MKSTSIYEYKQITKDEIIDFRHNDYRWLRETLEEHIAANFRKCHEDSDEIIEIFKKVNKDHLDRWQGSVYFAVLYEAFEFMYNSFGVSTEYYFSIAPFQGPCSHHRTGFTIPHATKSYTHDRNSKPLDPNKELEDQVDLEFVAPKTDVRVDFYVLDKDRLFRAKMEREIK